MIALYFGGILIGILMALFMRGTLFQGEAVPLSWSCQTIGCRGKNVGHLLWDKAKDFLQRAFTVIFMATLVIWFLQTFDLHLNIAADSKDSILALAAGSLAFFVCTHGLWRLADLHGADHRIYGKGKRGFDAFRVVGSTGALQTVLTPLSAASLLVFCLLYTPCVAAIASIRRELGGKWAVFVVVGQCVIAWIAAFVVYQVGHLFI